MDELKKKIGRVPDPGPSTWLEEAFGMRILRCAVHVIFLPSAGVGIDAVITTSYQEDMVMVLPILQISIC